MNAKRARKLAAQKLPTLDEMKALRSENQRLRGADLLLRSVVRKAGGNIPLTPDDLKDIPPVRLLPGPDKGVVLQTVWPEAKRPGTMAAPAAQDPAPAPDAPVSEHFPDGPGAEESHRFVEEHSGTAPAPVEPDVAPEDDASGGPAPVEVP